MLDNIIRVNDNELGYKLGKELNFIEYICLTDGTKIVNMSYEVDAEIPADKKIESIISRLK